MQFLSFYSVDAKIADGPVYWIEMCKHLLKEH